MEWLFLQLIVTFIAPWALKYIRKGQNMHSSVLETIALITLLSFVLSMTGTILNSLPNSGEYRKRIFFRILNEK